MKNYRKFVSKWQVVLPVTLKDYSGEEMFRGIFFLQGDVVNNL